ncbi:MAG: type ISP restriction/modification enzyme [Pirellulales bacterium]
MLPRREKQSQHRQLASPRLPRPQGTTPKIPPEVFDYRLSNRSALNWVIDQYQISTDKRSGITSDPNNPDDEQYIVRLVGQVARVSVETVKIVDALPVEYSDSATESSPKRRAAQVPGGQK